MKHLIVHVTNHCNFRCKHCFIDFSPKRDMKLESYQKIGRDVGPLFWLDIGGGEPFLRKDLAEIVSAFDVNVVQIPSNGSLPKLMVEQLRRMRRESNRDIVISLSVDGTRETHDEIRGQQGSWDQLWDTMAELRQIEGIYVKCLSVLQNGNSHQILEMMEAVREKGPDFHSVILFRGEGIDENVSLPPMDRLRELGPEIFKIQESYGYGSNAFAAHFLRNFHRYVWNVSLDILEQERQVIPCYAGTTHAVIMGNGDVSSCEMLPPVGNLNNSSWNDIMESDAFKEQVQGIKDKKCHCTHNCALFDSIFFNPRNIPKLIHQKVK